MIKKTKQYDIFHFREDNRQKIDHGHVEKLKQSITARNLLNLRPIIVNEDMEIIDGQHRLMAAKDLGVDIYYEMKEELKSNDIVLLNISKSWSMHDFLNYYSKNGNAEYQQLEKFIKEKGITLSLAFGLLGIKDSEQRSKFRHGQFKFNKNVDVYFDLCWQTIDIIKGHHGAAQNTLYTKTVRFWKALCVLFDADEFEDKIWTNNLNKFIESVGPRVSTKGYLKLFTKIYNHRTINKIDLSLDKEDEE